MAKICSNSKISPRVWQEHWAIRQTSFRKWFYWTRGRPQNGYIPYIPNNLQRICNKVKSVAHFKMSCPSEGLGTCQLLLTITCQQSSFTSLAIYFNEDKWPSVGVSFDSLHRPNLRPPYLASTSVPPTLLSDLNRRAV